MPAITDEASANAYKVTTEAEAKAAKLIEDAQNQATAIKNRSGELRSELKTQFDSLSDTVSNLLSQINELSGESMRMANNARDLVDEGLDLVCEDEG